MEVVDIGGAAAHGRPRIGAIQTIVMDDDGFARKADGAGNIISPTLGVDSRSVQPEGDIPDAVKRAASPGAKIAYPADHPGNREDLERTADGVLFPKGSQLVSSGPEVLGDVRSGYVTGPVGGAAVSQPSVPQPCAQPAAADLFARSEQGSPLIEVIYHTEIGVVASYYHRVEEAGNWLVLVVDNSEAAKQRFIPKPRETGAAATIKITVTGKDKRENTLHVVPLGIQFKLDRYDFVVMLINRDVEESTYAGEA